MCYQQSAHNTVHYNQLLYVYYQSINSVFFLSYCHYWITEYYLVNSPHNTKMFITTCMVQKAAMQCHIQKTTGNIFCYKLASQQKLKLPTGWSSYHLIQYTLCIPFTVMTDVLLCKRGTILLRRKIRRLCLTFPPVPLILTVSGCRRHFIVYSAMGLQPVRSGKSARVI